MPGFLMCIRQCFPAKRVTSVTGSLHMTIQTAVLIETMVALGADVRWANNGIFSRGTTPRLSPPTSVFFWKGKASKYWWCTDQALSFPGGKAHSSSLTTAATSRC